MPESLASLITPTAIVGIVVLVILLAGILLYWLRSRQRPLGLGESTLPPVQAPMPAAYPIDATQPTQRVNLPPGMYLVDTSDKRYPIDQLPAVIGRSPGSDVVLQDQTVSLAHARITIDPRLGLVVEELDTVNGITIDGHPTHKNLLYDGAQLTLGAAQFVFRKVGRSPEQPDDTLARTVARDAAPSPALSLADTIPMPAVAADQPSTTLAHTRPNDGAPVPASSVTVTGPLRSAPTDGATKNPTQPLPVPPAFGPRPRGAIFGDRFQLTEHVFGDGRQQRYLVAEIANGHGGPIWQCNRCGAVHARPSAECPLCGAPQGTLRPTLALVEATSADLFGSAYDLAARGLAHGGLRAPLASFDERLGAASRFCLAAAAVGALPERPERSQVFEWAPWLAQALAYLHQAGVTFGGQVDSTCFGFVDGRAVWSNFVTSVVGPGGAGRAQPADVRALARQLFYWLTGQTQYAPDPSLPPGANDVFSRALTGAGYASATELAAGLEQVRVAISAPRSMDYRIGRRTDVGRHRTLNEDSLLTLEIVRNQQSINRPLGVFVVADGMGGHAAGEIASGTIVNAIAQRALADLAPAGSDRPDRLPWLQAVVTDTNQKIYDMRQAAGTDMGSTLVMTILDGDRAYIAHVGDSRAYLVNAAGITRLTVDHSLVERLVATGQITPEQARTHEKRNVIYRTMGDRPQVEVDTSVHNLAPGDRLVLCTDGMSGLVEDSQIHNIVIAGPNPQAAAEALIQAANTAGGSDNITALVIEAVNV